MTATYHDEQTILEVLRDNLGDWKTGQALRDDPRIYQQMSASPGRLGQLLARLERRGQIERDIRSGKRIYRAVMTWADQIAENGWIVKTFDGQQLVGTGTFVDEAVARLIAQAHRDLGFTTRVRPAGITGQSECCDSCSDKTWAGRGYSKDARSADQLGEDEVS